MEVEFTADQRALARHAVMTGRLHNEEDAIHEALAMWEERERRRAEFRSSVEDARTSLAHGEGRPITAESMRELSAEVSARGRTRLAAELSR